LELIVRTTDVGGQAMSEYENYKSLFKPSEYNQVRFECRACGTTVWHGDVMCPECDTMLRWCEARVKDETTVKV